MRPHRVRLTHSLVKNYGLNKRLLVHRPQPRNDDELEMFHADGAARSLRRCPVKGPAGCDAENCNASGARAAQIMSASSRTSRRTTRTST